MPVKTKIVGVYLITCLKNSRHYIGGSSRCINRIIQHKTNLKCNRHGNHYLQEDYDKYGLENFEFTVIEECKEDQLLALEHYWCTILNTHNRQYGYNILPTHPYQANYGHAKETLQIISEKNKGRITSEEARKKMSIARTGKKHNPEWVEKRASQHRGKKRSTETCKRISENRNHKEVLQYSLSGELIKEWKDINEIPFELGINISGIYKVLNKQATVSNNFKWKYKISTEDKQTLNRNLYDLFDSHNIFITIKHHAKGKFGYRISTLGKISDERYIYTSRAKTEEKAFTESFKILKEKQLSEKEETA